MAGVSVSTVSKVVNGQSDGAPESRERLSRILWACRLGRRVRPPLKIASGPAGRSSAAELRPGEITSDGEGTDTGHTGLPLRTPGSQER